MNSRPLTSEDFPFVPIEVVVDGIRLVFEAMIDTGFGGDIVLPADTFHPDEIPAGISEWQLADGSVVQAPYRVGIVQIGDHGPYVVLISSLGYDPMVGLGVIRQVRLTLDHGTRVIVEQ